MCALQQLIPVATTVLTITAGAGSLKGLASSSLMMCAMLTTLWLPWMASPLAAAPSRYASHHLQLF